MPTTDSPVASSLARASSIATVLIAAVAAIVCVVREQPLLGAAFAVLALVGVVMALAAFRRRTPKEETDGTTRQAALRRQR